MERGEISSKLNLIIQEVFDDEDLVIDDDTVAEDVDAWDSINHLRLMMAIMEGFHIQFSGKEVMSPENVGQLVDMIAAKLKAS